MTKVIAALCKWLLLAFKFLAVLVINFLVDVINALIVAIATVFLTLLSVFPSTSLNFEPPAELLQVASHVNWFIPVGSIALAVSLLCASYVVYFSIRPVLKFLQLA